jgi:hypothetical protein
MGQLHKGKVWELAIYLDKKYVHIPALSNGVAERVNRRGFRVTGERSEFLTRVATSE